eukprot:TRINITY_DN9541_c0_g3_i1.p1 TRINITY_DN9541_c0_g3~~TRINITY_DN9541_c0_g3_i1.p1  ORF type:complete len:535 (+),score=79.59 TRINITY_DN9541_c0_g3_i1:44-1648(+)
MALLLLASAFVQGSFCVDTPLVIPSGLANESSVLTEALYRYGTVNRLKGRETVNCSQLLQYAPLGCDDIQVKTFCCASCRWTYRQCCVGDVIRIAVLNSTLESLWIYHPDEVGNGRWRGLMPDYVSELSLLMGFSYTFVPVQPAFLISGRLVASDDIDISITAFDASFFNVHALSLTFTRPIVEYHHSVAIRRSSRSSGFWRIFSPFSTLLWCIIGAAVVIAGTIFWLVDSRHVDGTGLAPSGAMGAVYFAITTLLVGGEGYEVTTWLGRLVRVSMLFFMLIVRSTYTAELASALTEEVRSGDGPMTLEEAQETKICCLYGKGSAACPSDRWVQPPTTDRESAIEYCLGALRAGIVDGVQSDQFTIAALVARNCDDLVVSSVAYAATELTFVLSQKSKHLAKFLNGAIAYIRTNDKFKEIQERHYPDPCVGHERDKGELVISVKHMSGLFILFASFCIIVMLLYLSHAFMLRVGLWRQSKHDLDSDPVELQPVSTSVTQEEIATIFANQRQLMNVLSQLEKRAVVPKEGAHVGT